MGHMAQILEDAAESRLWTAFFASGSKREAIGFSVAGSLIVVFV
jgi:hypothetical protein